MIGPSGSNQAQLTIGFKELWQISKPATLPCDAATGSYIETISMPWAHDNAIVEFSGHKRAGLVRADRRIDDKLSRHLRQHIFTPA